MKSDPAIQRTRDARRRISASVNDDPAKIVEYYLKMQERFAERLQRGVGTPELFAFWKGRAARSDSG